MISPTLPCPTCGQPLPADAPMGLCPDCLLSAGFGTITGDAPGGKPAPFEPPTPQEIAGHFPQLEILELLGHGGMGAVYKARQKQLDRVVALKILPPGSGASPAFAERFEREARALAKLHHPHIVTLYEFGQAQPASQPSALNAQPLYYFLMEFVDGVTLRHLLGSGRLAPAEALAIVPQICEALQFAHDRGIVHRDIKPENILLNKEGQVKIADFGVAKIVSGPAAESPASGVENAADATQAGSVLGTPSYMAPEQTAHPEQVDHRADIYALGVVFYQMLTGELPAKRLEAPSRKVQIDVRLDEVVLRALEKNPDLRYQQASVLKTQVETIAGTPRGEQQKTDPALIPKGLFGRIALVEVCDGKRAINWPGVIQTWVVLYGAILLGTFIAFGRWIPFPDLIASMVGVATLVTAALVKVELKKTIERLPPFVATEDKPRFSRTAIVGVVCALFGFLWKMAAAKNDQTSGFLQITIPWYEDLSFLLGISGPVGATILGWIAVLFGWAAVSQIRRSGGKLHGLRLALFDGLFFPLLALDAVIFGLGLMIVAFVSDSPSFALPKTAEGLGGGMDVGYRLAIQNFIEFGGTALICFFVDFLIIRRVWRAVNQPVESRPTESPAPPPGADRDVFRQPFEHVFGPRKPGHFWRWFVPAVLAAVALLLLIAGLLVVSDKRFADAQQQARGALQSELGDKLGKLLREDERGITYSRVTFDFIPDALRVLVHYSGLRSSSGGPLKGDLVLDYQPPDRWLVTGAGDLARINTSLQTAAHGFPWPTQRTRASAAAGTIAPAEAAADLSHLSFGPVIEREVKAAPNPPTVSADADLRAARAQLAEALTKYRETHPKIQLLRARIRELEAAATPEAASPHLETISRLVAHLSADHSWETGSSIEVTGLEVTKPVAEVVPLILAGRRIALRQILLTREVQIPGSLPNPYIAVLAETDQGNKVVLLNQHTGGPPPYYWWYRIFDEWLLPPGDPPKRAPAIPPGEPGQPEP
jgi:serine/threonine protein kinase